MPKSGFAPIDQKIIVDRLQKHKEQIARLYRALPNACWPTVERIPRKLLHNVEGELYPGRVLVGQTHAGSEDRLWAYLWKIDYRGSAKLEFRNELAEDASMPKSVAFEHIDFMKWCHLIASESSPVRKDGPWQNKMKTVVKVALLKEGFFDGAMISDLGTIGCIVDTIGKKLQNREDRGLVILPPIGHPIQSMRAPRFATIVASLRDALPDHAWFKVKSCHRYSETCHPGMVAVGKRGSDTVWAKMRKPFAGFKHSAFIHYFVGGKEDTEVLSNLCEEPIEFCPAFDLMRASQDNANENLSVWRSRMAMGIRIALIDTGHVQLNAIESLSNRVSVDDLITTIEKNTENMQHAEGRASETAAASVPQQTQSRAAGKLPSISRSRPLQPITPRSLSPRTIGRDQEQSDLEDTVTVAGPSSSPTLRRGTQAQRRVVDICPVNVSRKRSADCRGTQASMGEPSQQRQRLDGSQSSASKTPLSFLASMKEQLFTPTQSDLDDESTALKDRVATLEQKLESAQHKYTVHTMSAQASQSELLKKQETQETKYKALEQNYTRQKATLADADKHVKDLKVRLTTVEAEKKKLEAFKAKHIKEAQPQLVSLMTMEKLHELKASGKTLSGKDEAKARRDAERQYASVYGVDVERTRY